MGKVLKWMGCACGGCVVLGVAAGFAGYHFVWKPAKAKLAEAGVDFKGDAKQVAASMVMAGVKQAKPKLLEALPADERPQVEEAIALLDRKLKQLGPEEFRELGEAFKAFTQSAKENGGIPTREAAHQLGDECPPAALR